MIATPRLVMNIKTGEIQTIQALAVNNRVEITPFKQRNDSSGSHLKNLPSQQKEGKGCEPRYFIRPMPRIGNLQAPWLSQPGCCSPRNELTLNASNIIPQIN